MEKTKFFINLFIIVVVFLCFSVYTICSAKYSVSLDKSNKYISLTPLEETRDCPYIKFKKDLVSLKNLNLILGIEIEFNLDSDLKERIKKCSKNGEIKDNNIVNEIINEIIFAKNWLKDASERQQERNAGKRGYRLVSQRLTNSIPKFKLPTPFGEVELDLQHGESGKYYDILVYKGSYKEICEGIDKIVKKEKLKELAQIIEDYLYMPCTPDYIGSDFEEILELMKKDVKINEFFEDINNLNKGSDIRSNFKKLKECKDKRDNARQEWEKVKSAKRNKKKKQNLTTAQIAYTKAKNNFRDSKIKVSELAASLSAVLFIAESGPNRASDGGKLSRCPLKYIINNGKTFCDVFAGESPIFYPAIVGGTPLVRNRIKINNLKEKEKNEVLKSKAKIVRCESYLSDDSDDESVQVDLSLDVKCKELKNKFKELLREAKENGKLDEFEKKINEFSETLKTKQSKGG